MTRSAKLSEAAWARIEPLMPQAEGRSRPWRDHRQAVEGIVFRYRTGVAWRDLPERFGSWQAAWKRHHRFATDGTWDMLLRVIQSESGYPLLSTSNSCRTGSLRQAPGRAA